MKILVVAALCAVALAGCGQAAPESAKTTLESSPAPTASEDAAEPDGTASKPFAFGTLVPSSPDSRWNVTVTDTVVTDGSQIVLGENPYNELKDGWEYVLGRMTSVVNEDLPSADVGEPASPSSVMPAFVGSDGRIYEIWNGDSSAAVIEESWSGQPDIVAKPGIESTGRFAIQVPSSAIPGGQFATRNQVDGTVLYFGEPVK